MSLVPSSPSHNAILLFTAMLCVVILCATGTVDARPRPMPWWLSIPNGDDNKNYVSQENDLTLNSYPILPSVYHSNWTFFSTSFDAEDPMRTINGETFFQYHSPTRRLLVEKWKDGCVPIWPNANSKPQGECHFVNVQLNDSTGVSYLRYEDDDGKLTKCCVFASPWQGITPDFMKHFDVSEKMTTKTIEWYSSGGPPAGPFTYGWHKKDTSSKKSGRDGKHATTTNIPFGFGFAIINPGTGNGDDITPGYGVHRFYNVQSPGPQYPWDDLPQECLNAKPGQGGAFPGYNCPFDL